MSITARGEVIRADVADRSVLRRLMELYRYDWSELENNDVGPHGEYGYPYLDQYWVEEDRHPFLFRSEGAWAGFALVRTGDVTEMAEFFVLRRFRRGGVGRAMATELFGQFVGDWRVEQLPVNPSATEFWRRVVPPGYDEDVLADGRIVQTFRIAAPNTPAG